MFNLELNNYIDENENSGIIFIDSIPTYEQLIQINNELYSELYFLKYEQFSKEVFDKFETFINAFISYEYIHVHGVDEHIRELIGNEGLLTSLKDIVIKFAQWLWNAISQFIKWVESFFSSPKVELNSSSKNPKQAGLKAAQLLIRGKKSDAEKIKKELKQFSHTKSHAELSEGHTNTPGLQASRALYIPQGKSDIIHKLEQLRNTFEKNFNNQKEDGLSLKLIQDHINSIINIINGPKMSTNFDGAFGYIDSVSNLAIDNKLYMMEIHNRLKSVKPLSTNPSEQECRVYINNVSRILNTEIGVTEENFSEKGKQMRNVTKFIFSVFKSVYTLEIKLIKSIQPLATALYGIQHTFTNDTTIEQAAGAIEMRVKIPANLLTRIREAWNCSQLTINRIIISSIRSNTNVYGVIGEVREIPINGKHIPLKDVFISYQRFKNSVWSKDDEDAYRERLKKQNVDPTKYYINLTENRVEKFLRTLVHECRHLYQFLRKLYLKDIDKSARSHKEYLEFEHEMDARRAAMNFKFEESDVKWAEKILNECIRKEYKVLNEHWTFK